MRDRILTLLKKEFIARMEREFYLGDKRIDLLETGKSLVGILKQE